MTPQTQQALLEALNRAKNFIRMVSPSEAAANAACAISDAIFLVESDKTSAGDDDEVLFALQMALENDQQHQALALRTWMPRIKKWYELAFAAPSPSQDKPGAGDQQALWIPVSDRLPQRGIDVLVNDGHSVHIASLDPYGMWNTGFGRFRVTHWMPLPNPPSPSTGGE